MKAGSAAVATNRFERRRERTRQELLGAAARVLAEKGLHQTKISDIAAAADVGVGTFYLHFPTKEALFDAVVDEARRSAPDPVAKLRAADAAFFRFARDNREVFKIVFGHAAAYNDLIRRAQQLFIADIEQTLEEGIASGVFAPLPSALVAQATVGMATQMIAWWTENESVPLETMTETGIALALHGISAAGRPKGEHDG